MKKSEEILSCGCRPKIMLVDDMEFNLMPIRMMMQDSFKNIEIHQALNGQIALDMYTEALAKDCGCDNRFFKAIIMDINMPVMGGIEASKKILEV